MLHPVDEARPQAVGFVRGVEAGQLGQQLLVEHVDLAAGEVRTEAEVGSRATERHVVRWVAGDVEGVRVVEDILVPVP